MANLELSLHRYMSRNLLKRNNVWEYERDSERPVTKKQNNSQKD